MSDSVMPGMAIFGPPTSGTDLIIWIVEKAVSKLPIWQRLWQAFEVNILTNNPPAVAVNGSTVYIFYASKSEETQYIFYNTCTGSTWSGQNCLSGAATDTGPGAATFNGQVYVFWQNVGLDAVGLPPNGELFYMILDQPYYWQIQSEQVIPGYSAGVIMSCCPSAIVFNNSIYVFYQGPGPDGVPWYTQSGSGGGGTWSASTQVPNTGMSASPSTTVFTNPSGQTELYLFHQGGGNNGQLWYNVLDAAGNWAGDKQISSVSGLSGTPCSVVFDGSIYVLYYGPSSGFWYVSSSNGSAWSAPLEQGCSVLIM